MKTSSTYQSSQIYLPGTQPESKGLTAVPNDPLPLIIFTHSCFGSLVIFKRLVSILYKVYRYNEH